MNQSSSPNGGRRRKIDPSTQKKPSRGRLSGWISRGLSAAGRWLNQPMVGLPGSGGRASSPTVEALSRQRSLTPKYVRESWAELRQVTWPRFGQAMRLTFAVMIFSAFFAILVYNIDRALTWIFEEIILNESQNIRNFFNNIF